MNLFVSIIIPTLNAERTLEACLRAVREQDYPRELVEIVMADGGSQDRTIEIAKSFGVEKIVKNELKTGESGKSVGIAASRGELLAFVDSDNILDSKDWLLKMVEPFKDETIMASEPLWFVRRPGDAPLTRYFAMVGVNDPLCLFLGNYDRYSVLTNRWTDLPVKFEKRDGYLKLHLELNALPTVGANGFIIRRKLLDSIKWKPYFCDIDVMCDAVNSGFTEMAKVDCGLVHLYCTRVRDFARKQRRRVEDFLYYREKDRRQYPWDSRWFLGLFKFCFYSVTVLPLMAQAIKGWLRCRDAAWLYHVPCCWVTLWVYGTSLVRRKIGFAPRVGARDGWRQ